MFKKIIESMVNAMRRTGVIPPNGSTARRHTELNSEMLVKGSKTARAPLTCPHCHSNRIAYSRLRGYDSLKARFTNKKPYRCVDCYGRFWVKQDGVSFSKVFLVGGVVGLLALVVLVAVVDNSSSAQRVIESSSSVVDANVLPQGSRETARDANIDSTNSNSDTNSLRSVVVSYEQAGSDSASGDDIALTAQRPRIRSYEKPLTLEQQTAQVRLAKQQAVAAKERSEARSEQLKLALKPAEDELEALVKIEVGYFVERWREAWSDGDAERYFSTYSANFQPANDQSVDQWKANRRYRVKPEKKIMIELTDFNIVMREKSRVGVVKFNQRYQSGSYKEISRKQLDLIQEDGDWKIAAEVEL